MIFFIPCWRLSCQFQLFDSPVKQALTLNIIFLIDISNSFREPGLHLFIYKTCLYSVYVGVNISEFALIGFSEFPASKIRDDCAVERRHLSYHRPQAHKDFRHKNATNLVQVAACCELWVYSCPAWML